MHSERKFNKMFSTHRASRNGPAAPVLARPVFLKVKMKFNFYKKQLIKS